MGLKPHYRSIPTLFLVLATTISCIFHFNTKDTHFQEIDSDLVFYSLRDFKNFAPAYANFSYEKKNNLHRYYRESLVALVDSIALPTFLSGLFYVPYTSTYSPAPGLIYSAVYSFFPSYRDFMGVCLAVLLSLFHISVFILYVMIVAQTGSQWVGLLTALLYLFSIGHWSYAHNLGSPFWNYFSALLWMFVFTLSKPENRLRRLSITTGLLIFMNYLIVVYWLAFALWYFVKQGFQFPQVQKFIRAQLVAIFSIAICVLLFFQPGQGLRSSIYSLEEFPTEVEAMIINFAGVSSHQVKIQAGVLGIIFLIGLWALSFSMKRKNRWTDTAQYILFLSLTYLIFYFFLLLGFAATRHILFLSPIFFIVVGFGLLHIAEVFRGRLAFLIPLAAIGVSLGAIPSIAERKVQSQDLLRKANIPQGETVILMDSRFGLAHHENPAIITVPVFKFGVNSLRDLQEGVPYSYLSQWVPFAHWLSGLKQKDATGFSKWLLETRPEAISIISTFQECPEPLVKFLPAETYGNGFQKPNCLYHTRFQLKNSR